MSCQWVEAFIPCCTGVRFPSLCYHQHQIPDSLPQKALLFAVKQHILMLRRIGRGQHKACALHLRLDQPTAGCWDPRAQQAHHVKSYCIVSRIS